MISLTVKEGQLRDWARSNSPPLPGTPQSIPGRPQSMVPLGSSSSGSQFPQCILTLAPNQILLNSLHVGLPGPHAGPFLLA